MEVHISAKQEVKSCPCNREIIESIIDYVIGDRDSRQPICVRTQPNCAGHRRERSPISGLPGYSSHSIIDASTRISDHPRRISKFLSDLSPRFRQLHTNVTLILLSQKFVMDSVRFKADPALSHVANLLPGQEL